MPDDKRCMCGNGKIKGACSEKNYNVIDINQYRQWRSGQRLRRRVAEFADSEIFLAEMEIARELYFSVMEPELVDENDDFLMERFFEWFIFDYRIRRRTILDYLNIAGGLTGEEKALLEKWRRARSSVYRVLQVGNNDYEITLRDLIRNREVRVRDRQAVCEIEPGQILYIRVLPMGVINEFSTGGLILPGYFESYLLNRIKVDAELFWSKKNRRGSWDIYLRERAHLLNAMVMEMGVLWELPEERTGHQLPGYPQMAGDNSGRQSQDNFLDYFYDRWVNEPMELLMGKTPLEAYKTKSGREKLQKLLLKMEKIGDLDTDIPVDLTGLWKKLNAEYDALDNNATNYTDVDLSGDGGVSKLICDSLNKMGYRPQQVHSAVAMWQKYKDLARPTFRKPGVWAAAVIYALFKSQGKDGVNQNDLAQMFNVSASTISNKYSSIRRILQLDGK